MIHQLIYWVQLLCPNVDFCVIVCTLYVEFREINSDSTIPRVQQSASLYISCVLGVFIGHLDSRYERNMPEKAKFS